MADISITAANVIAGSGAKVEHGTSGDTITAGKLVYRDQTTGRFELADSNSATAAARKPRGFALHGAADGQPLAVLYDGPITLGAVLTAGVGYYLSDTPGGMCPVADIGSGEFSVFLGMATSTSVLDVNIQASGVSL
jgi:hypothetical protein